LATTYSIGRVGFGSPNGSLCPDGGSGLDASCVLFWDLCVLWLCCLPLEPFLVLALLLDEVVEALVNLDHGYVGVVGVAVAAGAAGATG